MLLGLEMADWVDQSFVKVHFHRMTIEYSNWLVNKIADKEVDMDAMRKQFLRDNWERHEANNYEFKRRDNNDKVPSTDGTCLALNMFILKVDVKLLGLGII